ncbi:conjugal transfer protein [Lapidilactobacillus mulanensis]|uniref:Conjugal transfer protein n=2 Tax=Lactobacillaceae TaxID=33958 RepID=A0ABW4DLC0_9LACO|nr:MULTISPECIES: conjugal transfer protein [Lactobacillaceae]
MKKVRSYTSIWSVEKVLYAINDMNLPFPVTFTQMTWFIISLFVVMLLADVPPLSFIDGAFLKYFGIPAGITWFMSQKTFDNKRPLGFLRSIITYAFTTKVTFAGKPVKTHQRQSLDQITYVRRSKQ